MAARACALAGLCRAAVARWLLAVSGCALRLQCPVALAIFIFVFVLAAGLMGLSLRCVDTLDMPVSGFLMRYALQHGCCNA